MGEYMEIKDGFVKVTLGRQAYVLPYGQNIADFCEGFALNDTGEILWKGLEDGLEEKELVSLLKREYGLGDEMEPQLIQDVEHFQKYLADRNMFTEERGEEYGWNPLYFATGPLKVAYKGPELVYEKYFQNFACEGVERQADLTIQIACVPPRYHRNGRVLLRNEEIVLMETGGEYIFLFPGFPVLQEMQVKKDGSYALLFCDYDLIEEHGEDIFHGIRFAFLLAASARGLFFLHSASLLYRERAWLFSGKSGAGKSTHTNLWREAFAVELLNGDLNMLGMEDDRVMVYGQPWCGTSGISTEKSYPLGGITFLKKDRENRCEEPERPEKILSVIQRMISPAWEQALFERNISFAEKVEAHCPVWRLFCRPDREAAEVMRRAVDRSLEQSFRQK